MRAEDVQRLAAGREERDANAFVVEINECAVLATRNGSAWWIAFRHRYDPTGRIEDVDVSLGGNRVHVAVDDREHAEWLIGHMVGQGIPASAVKAKKGAA